MDKETTIKDFILPFKVLVSPLRAFSQIAQKPSGKGLISLSALILVSAAAAIYAYATKIDLNINGPTSLMMTDTFNGWFVVALAYTVSTLLLFWLFFTVLLTLISRLGGGKQISSRILFVGFGYLLSVFIVVSVMQTAMYLALPSIYFEEISSWPVEQAQMDFVMNRVMESWGSLLVYRLGFIFTYVAIAWLVILGAIAVRAFRECSWIKAAVFSTVSFIIAFIIIGLPWNIL